ncbi:recombinase family protein [Streptomyces sp. KM273126]|uniref:recombinase family protein n=1 Tax=Streptomyces sp. KM273126 TaxID=2545247 RepID=UPI00267AB3E5|nr:recombinase family protein [Streptomyces sp. KM273126]
MPGAECRKGFADKKSGKDAPRPELKACHAFLDSGDTLVVPSLDRYGRSLQDLIDMVAQLRERGIGFTSLHENLDTTTLGGRVGGRPHVAGEEIIRTARDLLPDPGRSITSIAKLLGVSAGTLYNHIQDLRELCAGTVSRQLEAPAK